MTQVAFQVKPEHLKLLHRLRWGYDTSAYEGVPCPDFKRPYGNSNILEDIAEILGVEFDPEVGIVGENAWDIGLAVSFGDGSGPVQPPLPAFLPHGGRAVWTRLASTS